MQLYLKVCLFLLESNLGLVSIIKIRLCVSFTDECWTVNTGTEDKQKLDWGSMDV